MKNKLFWSLLLIVLVSSMLASRVQTAGGQVQVYDIKIPTQNGQWLVADLFKPSSATAASPHRWSLLCPASSVQRKHCRTLPLNSRVEAS